MMIRRRNPSDGNTPLHTTSLTSSPIHHALILLICSLLTFTSLLQTVSGQALSFELYYNTPGVTTLTRTTYGDVTPFTVSFTAASSIGANFYIQSPAVLSDPTSFIQFGTVLPTSPSGTNQNIQLQWYIDPSTAVANTYTQTATITAALNSNSATTEAQSITITVIVDAALNYYTNTTATISTGKGDSAPTNITEGTKFEQIFSLRSLPTADVRLDIGVNVASGDYPNQVGPQGQPLRGGGPLVTASVTTIIFSTTNYSQPRQVDFQSIHDPQMQGSRWTLVTFTFTSADSFYNSLVLAPLNITIREKDYATIQVVGGGVTSTSTGISYSVTPNVTPDQTFTVSLGAQPRSTVFLTLSNQPRWSLSPNNITFNDTNYNVPQVITLHIYNSSVISGARYYVQNFTAAVSADADFNGLILLPLRLSFSDVNNVLESISPPFANYIQDPTSPTYITVSYASTKTFLPTSINETALPTISCVFGNVQECDFPQRFFGPNRSPGCAYPYAQILVSGNVISPSQVSCPIPTCPSSSSTATNPGLESTTPGECLSFYYVVVLVNGEGSSNAIELKYLTPVGSAGETQQPQVNSIEPNTIDVNSYAWITVHGANFDLAKTYPNPAVPTGATRTGTQRTDLTTCKIADIVVPAVDTTATELDANGKTITMIKCYSRPRPDLAGSTSNKPVVVEVSINGQEYTTQSKTINLFDYDKKKENNYWTYFFIAVALIGMSFAVMLLQHFLCANFFRGKIDAGEDTKIRVTRGPQMLIDLLEPQVHAQTLLVKEIEKEEAVLAKQLAQQNDLAAQQQDVVKARIAEIQREAQAKKEEKKRLKAEKKLAKEAAKEAERARNEVLIAAGLEPVTEAGSETSETDEEREERKRKKKEKKAAKEAAKAAASAAPAEQGVELVQLDATQLAKLDSNDGAQPPLSRGSSHGSRHSKHSELQVNTALPPSMAAHLDSARSHGSSGDEKGSHKKKKDKKHKKEKKHSRKSSEVEMEQPLSPLSPNTPAPESEPMEAPLSPGAMSEEVEHEESGGSGGGHSEKKKKKHSKSSKKKKEKKHGSSHEDEALLSPANLAAAHASSTAAVDVSPMGDDGHADDEDEEHGGGEEKVHKKKKSHKKKESKKKKKE